MQENFSENSHSQYHITQQTNCKWILQEHQENEMIEGNITLKW